MNSNHLFLKCIKIFFLKKKRRGREGEEIRGEGEQERNS